MPVGWSLSMRASPGVVEDVVTLANDLHKAKAR